MQAWKDEMDKMEVFGANVGGILGKDGRVGDKRFPCQWRTCILRFLCKNNGVCSCAGRENLIDAAQRDVAGLWFSSKLVP